MSVLDSDSYYSLKARLKMHARFVGSWFFAVDALLGAQ